MPNPDLKQILEISINCSFFSQQLFFLVYNAVLFGRFCCRRRRRSRHFKLKFFHAISCLGWPYSLAATVLSQSISMSMRE